MELTGKVILDEDTMDMLKEEVREEVIRWILSLMVYSGHFHYLNQVSK